MSPYTTRAHRKQKKGLNGSESNDLLNGSVPPPLSTRSPGWYDLSTVVVHTGKIDGGHYYCYARRDDQWFKFDDSKVTLASEAQVLEAEAYMLFYVVRSLGGPAEKAKDKDKGEDADADEEGEENGEEGESS